MKSFFLLVVAVIFGAVFIIWYLQPWTKVVQPIVSPPNNQPSTQVPSKFSLEEAPSQSLRGNMLSLSNEVFWQSRTATDSSKLEKTITIQQGEKITTGDSSSTKIQFPETGTINISPNTKLEFAQTLPSSIVLNQSQGTTEIIKDGPNPISLRSLHLLIKLNPGNFSINTDPETSTIIIKSQKGSAQIAYNDIDSITQVVDILEKQQLIYHDETRKVIIKKF